MCHVLIIEDEALVALSLQATLEDAGGTSFDIADCEADAVSAACTRRPEIIVSDVKLRVGRGPAAVARIHDRWGEIPVIYVTGTPEDCRGCCPSEQVFTKPVMDEALSRAFRSLAPTG